MRRYVLGTRSWLPYPCGLYPWSAIQKTEYWTWQPKFAISWLAHLKKNPWYSYCLYSGSHDDTYWDKARAMRLIFGAFEEHQMLLVIHITWSHAYQLPSIPSSVKYGVRCLFSPRGFSSSSERTSPCLKYNVLYSNFVISSSSIHSFLGEPYDTNVSQGCHSQHQYWYAAAFTVAYSLIRNPVSDCWEILVELIGIIMGPFRWPW